jgi:small subunit ribosomal protein S17e
MGRIKTTFIKSKTRELLDIHREKFTTDFTENKLLVSQLAILSSKKLRNTIAGYLTRLKRKEA